jgi:hypothetical protein
LGSEGGSWAKHAAAAVKEWKFKAFEENGRPVAVGTAIDLANNPQILVGMEEKGKK